MVDKKITEMDALGGAPAQNDLIEMVDVSEALDEDKNKKMTVAELGLGLAVQKQFVEPFTNALAATTTGKANQYGLDGGAATLSGLVQTDHPRNVVLTIGDIDASIGTLNVTVTGTLANGETAQTEDFAQTAAGSHAGDKAFAKIDSIVVGTITGATAGDTLDVGHGVKMGMGNAISASGDVYKVTVDQVDETPSNVIVAFGTVGFATAPDGAKDYQTWYKGS
jgi:hypothetical protein